MRAAIRRLAALGPLPATDAAQVDQLEQYQQLLTGLQPPVSDAEAQVLTGLFPPDLGRVLRVGLDAGAPDRDRAWLAAVCLSAEVGRLDRVPARPCRPRRSLGRASAYLGQ